MNTQTGENDAEGQSRSTVGLDTDQSTEGWTWHIGGRKWHYYRNYRAVCGKMMLIIHPSEGYAIGNDGSRDNCAACQKRLAKVPNVKLRGRAL